MRDNHDMRIASLLEKHKFTEFQWGVFDCCQFAIESLKELHGFSVELEEYSTQIDARKVFKKRGGSFDSLLSGFGLVEGVAASAKRGDLVLVKNEDAWGCAIALVVGLHAMCPTFKGLQPAPRSQWLKSWSVSCPR